jgi:DNA-binding beta-propeller fold protein YncE
VVRSIKLTLLTVCAVLVACGGQGAHSQTDGESLVLERAVDLPGVTGRIDHMAIDLHHRRLFVAALGAGSVEVIDVDRGQAAGRITGLPEPQGVGYLPERDELVVASGDGKVRFYRAADLSLTGSLTLGEDADNVRIDPRNGHVVVGYGDGALASIDPATRAVVSTLPLPTHPEGFRLDPAHGRAFINLPGRGQIAVGDLATGKVTATRTASHSAGYPMMFDVSTNVIAVAYRLPPRLVISDADSGKVLQDIGVCGDSDDLFLDQKRLRIYVSCGGGELDVLQQGKDGYRRIDRIRTRPGARTSLFVPELDRLFVAARATGEKPASILVFRPR